jgi:hypothetical protein
MASRDSSEWRLLFHESGLGMSKMSSLRLSVTFALQTACGDVEVIRRLRFDSTSHSVCVLFNGFWLAPSLL